MQLQTTHLGGSPTTPWYTPATSATALGASSSPNSRTDCSNSDSPTSSCCSAYGAEERFSFTDLLHLASGGSTPAQYNLALRFDNAVGLPPNPEEAFKWYRLAATNGHLDAQYNLACCLYDGVGTETDAALAVHWYQLAADRGHRHAQCNLGHCYQHGSGVEQNIAEAILQYTKAAEPTVLSSNQVHPGIAHAQLNLGRLYMTGNGVCQSYTRALMWFELAAAAHKGPVTTNDAAVESQALALVEYCLLCLNRCPFSPTAAFNQDDNTGIALQISADATPSPETAPVGPVCRNYDIDGASDTSSEQPGSSIWSRLATRGSEPSTQDGSWDCEL